MERLDSAVLVFAPHDDESGVFSLSAAARDALLFARELTTGPLVALSLVQSPDLEQMATVGVNQVFQVDASSASPNLACVLSKAVLAAIERLNNPCAVVFPSGQLGKEAGARVAVATRGAVTGDVTRLRVENGSLVATKDVLDGSWQTTYIVGSGGSLAVLSLGSVLTVSQACPEGFQTNPCDLTIETLEVDFGDELNRVVLDSDQPAGSGQDLSSAGVVVCVGRGAGPDLDLAKQLTQRLGGVMGATRVAVDQGWIERSAQIGQTGVSVSPQVYIGLGVSGAVHHACAIRGSRFIIAVCDDADAPIFELCDFGVVGDVSEVLPALLERLA